MSEVTIYYMQMTARAAVSAKPSPDGLTFDRVDPPDGRVNRRYYEAVGRGWTWHDRLVWTDDQWASYANREGLSTWVGRLDGSEIGYVELDEQADGIVQLCYFGLLPDYIGRGLGGAMLTRAIETAWAMPGTRRIWLHTCTGDHPNALKNYEARGFEVYRTETAPVKTPDA